MISSTRIAVGLSGGVDSSVTAALLKESGYDVIGITMRIFDNAVPVRESRRHACYGPGEQEDMDAAADLCTDLRIPFHIIDLREEYRHYVLDYVRRGYLSGTTPNPCIACNRHLKFGFLLKKAERMGIAFQLFATGHYARIQKRNGHCLLRRAVDRSKDQTYFLYTLSPELLSRIMFPLGSYYKHQTRQMARDFGIRTAERVESQDFIAGGDYAVLFDETEFREGDIVDVNGNVIGRHRGIVHYTLGQRQGMGIASDRPLYVLEIDPQKNRIAAGGKEALYSNGLIARDLNWVGPDALDRPHCVQAKIRLNHRGVDAKVLPYGADRAKVVFVRPQMAVAPGQSVVLYSGDTVVGGGIIEQAIR